MKSFFKQIIVNILIFEARILLRRKNPTVIAVTGSVGKTGTKDAIYSALKSSVTARKSQKSFNSEIGVPLTILGLQNGWSNPVYWVWNIIDGACTALFVRSYPEVLVIETGVDVPGDMKRVSSWLKPDVVVVTRLPDIPVHVEHFKSPEAQRAEETAIISDMREGGVVIYNADDDNIIESLVEERQKTVSYGRYRDADVTVKSHEVYYYDNRPAGTRMSILAPGLATPEKVEVPSALGVSHAYSAAAAIATAQHLGVSASDAIIGLADRPAPLGRMRLVPAIKGAMIIDDSYNSSPVAMEHALDTMSQVRGDGRRIAVIGDMLELGKFTVEQHEFVGAKVARTCDVLFTVGVRARGFAVGAQAAGMSEQNIFQYENSERAGRELQAMLQSGDLVLVKGSQGVRTEKIVKEVMAEPETASSVLARQDAAWQ